MNFRKYKKVAADFQIDDYIFISGKPLKIDKIRHLNRYPLQICQIFVAELPGVPLVVSPDWELDCLDSNEIEINV